MNTGKQINAMVVVLFLHADRLRRVHDLGPVPSHDTKDDAGREDAGARARPPSRSTAASATATAARAARRRPAARRACRSTPTSCRASRTAPSARPQYDAAFKLVTNTIMCGRVGTSMPTWGAIAGRHAERRADPPARHADHQGQLGPGAGARRRARRARRPTTRRSHAERHVRARTRRSSSSATPGRSRSASTSASTRSACACCPKQLEVERGVDGTEAAEHDRGTRDHRAVPCATQRRRSEDDRASERRAEPVEPTTSTALPVGDNGGFAVGDVLQIEDEHVRVTGIMTGIPTHGPVSSRRTSAASRRRSSSAAPESIEVGDLIRIDSELMEVHQVIGDGGTGIELDQDATAHATRVSVDDPTFFREGYSVRVGDEWMRGRSAPSTRARRSATTIGRAQTTLLGQRHRAASSEGMIIRIDGELLRVDGDHPARARRDRRAAHDGTTTAPHAAGHGHAQGDRADRRRRAGAGPTSTGQALLEAISVDGTVDVVTGTAEASPSATSTSSATRPCTVTARRRRRDPAHRARACRGHEAREHARRSADLRRQPARA